MKMKTHSSISLRNGLQLSDRELTGLIINDDGKVLTPDECRDLFIAKIREGYDVLPVCDHHDERGYCKGHTDAR